MKETGRLASRPRNQALEITMEEENR